MFLKIILLGAARVGKSSLLSRFCSSRSFEAGYQETTSPDFNGARVRLQSGQEAVVQIWDLPGNTAHHAHMAQAPAAYMRDAHVCVLVCDMCSKESFLALERLRAEFLAANFDQSTSVAFVLLINKAEPTHARKQAVFASDVLAWCARHNIRHFYETSALSDTNVLIALVNMTQLAADMDLVRRGVKIACDAKELARQEEEQARIKAEAKAKEEEERLRAERAAQEEADAAARAEQERVETEAKRAADFEARWSAQRLEAEEAAAAAAAEKAAAAARARERSEKRKASIAQSAYGPYKQRPHRLNAALIQQHAQAAGADPSSLGLLGPALSPSPGSGDDAPPASPRRAGTLPSSSSLGPPRAARPVQSRPSSLGMGTGAMLRQTLQQLEAVTERSAGAAAARGGGSTTPGSTRLGSFKRAASQNSSHRSKTSLSTHARSESQEDGVVGSIASAAGGGGGVILEHGSMRPHAPSTPPHSHHNVRHLKRAHLRAQSFGMGTDERTMERQGHHHQQQQQQNEQTASTAAAESLPAMVPAVDADAASASDDESEGAASDGVDGASTAEVVDPPLDPVTEALLDVVAAQVPFTRGELLRLHAPFEGHPGSGMPWQGFRSMWMRVAARVPAWTIFAERFFAAMDSGAASSAAAVAGAAAPPSPSGRVDFESFALGLSALCGSNIDARAKLLFRVLDFAHVPFLERAAPHASDEAAGEQGPNAESPPVADGGHTEAEGAGASLSSPAPAPLTKKSFLQRQRRELQGMERFAYLMYDDGIATAAAGGAGESTAAAVAPSKPPDRFITRDCVAKMCAALMHSTPAFEAALRSHGVGAAGGVDARRLQLSMRLQPVVAQLVDGWFDAAGYGACFTLSELQWRDAVQRQPHIIQPFAPPVATAAKPPPLPQRQQQQQPPQPQQQHSHPQPPTADVPSEPAPLDD